MPYKFGGIPPGTRFGKLTVVCRDTGRTGQRNTYNLCRCACGGGASVRTDHLRYGLRVSCGDCFLPSAMRKPRVYKAPTGPYSRERRSWEGMISRCTRPGSTRYYRYGGRGITVCERWRDFNNFVADMGPRPEGLTLDRIDNDGNYEPGNCRWATPKEQIVNSTSAKPTVINGVLYATREMAAISLGLSRRALYQRLKTGKIKETPLLTA